MVTESNKSPAGTCGERRVYVDCPSCEGEGHHGFEPESGLPYDCYFCCNAGRVLASEADEYTKDLQGQTRRSES